MARHNPIEPSASEVIADLNGPGFHHEDGRVWDGEEFLEGDAAASESFAYAQEIPESNVEKAKKEAQEKYLRTYRARVIACEQSLRDAEARLEDAKRDLVVAEVHATRWYGS